MAGRGPGSRGGRYWIDEHNKIRYGNRPVGAHRPIQAARPVTTPDPTLQAEPAQPHGGEFGQWSHAATAIYLKQALRYAPCLARVIQRYLEMVSAYGVGAAADAFKQLTPEDVPAATSALGRLRRLAHWDRYGRVQAQGIGTPLPTGQDPDPLATMRHPFVKAAMRNGMSKDDALLWQQLALRCMSAGKAELGGSIEDTLLSKSASVRWRVLRGQPARLNLQKAVMNPGSRGGHIYWKNGKLHYGIPSGPSSRKRGSAMGGSPTWQGPSALARALMRQGRRVEYRNTAGLKVWGDIITAAGDILSVLPDDARPYDLLHTVAVPVSAVIRVESDPDDPTENVRKSYGNEGPLGGDAGSLESPYWAGQDEPYPAQTQG